MISSFKYSFEGKFDESAYLIFRWLNINVRLAVLPGNYFTLTGILSCSLLFHFLIRENFTVTAKELIKKNATVCVLRGCTRLPYDIADRPNDQ